MTLSRVTNAIDIEAKKDWYDMYEDISNNIPKKVKILIDLKAVKQACRLNVSCLSDLCDSSSKMLLCQHDRDSDDEDEDLHKEDGKVHTQLGLCQS